MSQKMIIMRFGAHFSAMVGTPDGGTREINFGDILQVPEGDVAKLNPEWQCVRVDPEEASS